ncbi:MAG TPA: LLM class flavin-dependent oxidoreductase, partial [Methylomirabilota bacterium]
YPRCCLADGVERLQEGAARGGHPERVPVVSPSLPTVVADDPAAAREGAAWFVAFYLVSMGTLYRQSLTRQGFGKEVEAVLAANAPKFTGAVPPEAEALLEELTVFGTPPEARRRLARWHAAGAELPVLLLRPNRPVEELEYTLDALRPRDSAARG